MKTIYANCNNTVTSLLYQYCLWCYSESISTLGKLRNMPEYDGNRTYDLWYASPTFRRQSYAVTSVRVRDISELSPLSFAQYQFNHHFRPNTYIIMSQFCWNKFATSVIFPSSLLEVVNNLFPNLFQQLRTIKFKNNLSTGCERTC